MVSLSDYLILSSVIFCIGLVELEKIVQPEKKTDFQKLQGWVHSKRHIH